jgi:hypothetical protein
MMWVLLDPAASVVERHFEMYPTGGYLDALCTKGSYIATFQTEGLVFHVFER